MTTADTADAPINRNLRIRKTLRISAWVAAFISALLFFTISKLPDDRIGAMALSKLSDAFATSDRRPEITAEKTHISILLLGRVRLQGVRLRTTTAKGSPVTINWDELRISPSLFDLLLGRLGGSIKIIQKDRTVLTTSFWTKTSGAFSLSTKLDQADLGEGGIGLLPIIGNLSAVLPISGSIQLSGDSNPTTASGSIALTVGNTAIPAQTVEGYPVPAIRIGDSEIRISVEKGKAKFETFRLGRMDRDADDIRGTLSGGINLDSNFSSSQLNLKGTAKISDSILNAYFFITAVTGSKQSDGAFHFNITGPMIRPTIAPSGGSP